MNLQRYNEVAFAVLSTVALLGALVAVVTFSIEVLSEPKPKPQPEPPGVIVKPSDEPKPKQALLFCLPSQIEGSSFEYFPVSAVNQRDATENPRLGAPAQSAPAPWQMSRSESVRFPDCGRDSYVAYGRIFNVVIRNVISGEERLLFKQPGQVKSLQGPAERCKDGVGDMPCGLLLWKLRPADSNGDGKIDEDDALVAYASGVSGADLRPVTPLDATVLSSVWMPMSNRLVFQIRFDTNKDGKFSGEDGADIFETEASNPTQARAAFHEPTMKHLRGAIQ